MTSSWEKAALIAAKRLDAYDLQQVIKLLRGVPEDQLDDVCEQYRLDYPCLFYGNVRDGLGNWNVDKKG